MVISPMVDIVGISLALSIVSQIVQKKFMNRDEMKKHQESMKEKNKRMKELIGKDDHKSKNELEALEKEMLESMQKMMNGSMKVMIASSVVFLPAYWLLGHFYGTAVIDLPIPIPWFVQGFNLFDTATWKGIIEIYHQTNWLGWYLLTYLLFSMAMNAIVDFIKKKGVVKNG